MHKKLSANRLRQYHNILAEAAGELPRQCVFHGQKCLRTCSGCILSKHADYRRAEQRLHTRSWKNTKERSDPGIETETYRFTPQEPAIRRLKDTPVSSAGEGKITGLTAI